MATGYPLFNGLLIGFGTVIMFLSFTILLTGGEASLLLIISLLTIMLGLQGWHHIQTMVRIEELHNLVVTQWSPDT